MADTKAYDRLNLWIHQDAFTSLVDKHLDELRNPVGTLMRTINWYTTARDASGEDVAETQLAAIVAEQRLHEVGAAILPAVQGLMKLARAPRADPRGNVLLVKSEDARGFRGWAGSEADLVMAFNPDSSGCPCHNTPASGIFGRYAPLGLRAITVSVNPRRPASTRLCLLLPYRHEGAAPSDYVVADFRLTGEVSASYKAQSWTEEGSMLVDMGVISIEHAMHVSGGLSTNHDDLLGPGCTDMLRREVPNLGAYLSGVATRLTDHHS
jgi:hypothetical protein